MSLIFVDDNMAGIVRKPFRKKWRYFCPQGTLISDPDEIRRLDGIGLPPAYTDAWFAPSPHAHILATGWDSRRRKQYRYHPEFRAQQESRKFEECCLFGARLPKIRARVYNDLSVDGLNYERAIASVVRLLDTGAIRVGNESYVKANRSYGATTLRMRHARIQAGRLHLSFKAKSGKLRDMHVSDKGLVRFVKQMQDLPGQHLFQYIDENGSVRPVGSSDVNAYIQDAMGGIFSAKTFRTWTASVLAFDYLHRSKGSPVLKEMLEAVSSQLGNTPAIARKSYIHPALVEQASTGTSIHNTRLPRSTRWLTRQERGLLQFLDDVNTAPEMAT